ncbi:hypothetical protein MGYG_07026 [Nannizzia gypsea CBS 118893]|uniref:Uncharacterized protein n=1 Tax=Arthroderma gypseum (strain ATCC MYA-4604 / CBS 118893) TaxID=535722 RepID=E4V1V6_ARTGP|nr:hypothetical protein MGYG_07026 [Nannizzia gypsea CBS 118893]EFR04021.1 hypothetical protein MGYG_07026 [Nannizzia gypsea CBS 118893]
MPQAGVPALDGWHLSCAILLILVLSLAFGKIGDMLQERGRSPAAAAAAEATAAAEAKDSAAAAAAPPPQSTSSRGLELVILAPAIRRHIRSFSRYLKPALQVRDLASVASLPTWHSNVQEGRSRRKCQPVIGFYWFVIYS